MNNVTLSADEARNALNTLVFADSVLLNLAPQTTSMATVREELLELRRLIARRLNAKPARPWSHAASCAAMAGNASRCNCTKEVTA